MPRESGGGTSWEVVPVRVRLLRFWAALPSPCPPARTALRSGPGVVGSIHPHCDGYWAAAVAWEGQMAAIGIDAEPHRPLSAGVAYRISSRRERAELQRLSACEPLCHWDLLLFPAKESVYKAWSQ